MEILNIQGFNEKLHEFHFPNYMVNTMGVYKVALVVP